MIKVIVIICIIILFFVIDLGIEGFTSNKEVYRLGDIVKSEFYRKELSPIYIKKYPETIAGKYIKKTKKNNDIPTLLKIIRRYPNRTPQNAIVVHIRIGDVIDNAKRHTINDFLKSNVQYGNKINYVKPLSYYDKINFKNFPTKKIILVGGFHQKGDHTKSYEYVIAIRNYFQERGYKVETRIDVENDPDSDFVYMCNAKYFVSSGGGFSGLIKKIVSQRGI